MFYTKVTVFGYLNKCKNMLLISIRGNADIFLRMLCVAQQ